jgi:hypothetical protein
MLQAWEGTKCTQKFDHKVINVGWIVLLLKWAELKHILRTEPIRRLDTIVNLHIL